MLRRFCGLMCVTWMACFLIPSVLFAQTDAKMADALYFEGKFVQAEKAYRQLVAKHADKQKYLLRLAEIALLQNKLKTVKQLCDQAKPVKQADIKKRNRIHAEMYYRLNQFDQASAYFAKLGRHAKAKKLASFKRQKLTPYSIDQQQPETTTIKFERTDPLPVVAIRVNGGKKIFAIIDTGGSELIISPEIAKSAKATTFGSEQSMFAGGKKMAVVQGRIDSLTMGELTVKHVPVHILPTRRFAAAAGGMKIDAVIGTVLLKQFRFTIDYPGQSLILTRPSAKRKTANDQIDIPFYLGSDHLVLTWGSVNKSKSMLFFVDTGLAGQAFTCPKSTLDQAGIKPAGPKFQGMGGGGKIDIQLFTVDSLKLGSAEKNKLTGLFGPFPESLEKSMGFRIGGLISHAFFRDYSVTFDFQAMKMMLSRKKR